MICLLKSELKKVFAHRFLAVLLFLLLLFNVVTVWRTEYPENKYGPYVSAMLDAYLADSDSFLAEVKAQEEYLDTIDILQQEYVRAEREWKKEHPGEDYPVSEPWAIPRFVPGELNERTAIAQFYAVLSRAEDVAATKDAAIERAKSFWALCVARGETDSFAARYQVALANNFISEDRDAVTYPTAYAYGWDCYLTYGGDSVFLLLAAVLLGATLLLPEQSGGFAEILRVTKRGRAHTALAKGAVCLLLCLGLSLLFSLVTLAAFAGRYGLSGWNFPLQSFFPYAILHLRVWQAVLLRTLLRALATFSTAMLCVLLSVFFRSTVTVCALGGGIVAVFYVLSQLELFYEHSPLHLFNLFTMLSGSAYFESWNAVSLFGLCADYGIALPVLLIATGALLTTASTLAFSRLGIRSRRHA